MKGRTAVGEGVSYAYCVVGVGKMEPPEVISFGRFLDRYYAQQAESRETSVHLELHETL